MMLARIIFVCTGFLTDIFSLKLVLDFTLGMDLLISNKGFLCGFSLLYCVFCSIKN